MTYKFALVTLLMLACVSPLLTWLHLWQMKEWRWDRLLEHMGREGLAVSIRSQSRVVVGEMWLLAALSTMLLGAIGVLTPTAIHWRAWALAFPAILALMTVLQLSLRRQPMPVWTRKAQLLTVLSLILNLGLTVFFLTYTITTIALSGNVIEIKAFDWAAWLLPYLQPLIAIVVWTILLPLDRILKARIMHRARAVVASHSHLTVIGITGSVGKTTTKELIAHVLRDFRPLVTPEHVNTEMGVSQWLIRELRAASYERPDSTHSSEFKARSSQLLIIEMGAYRVGEIALLCSIVKPHIGVITSIGEQHVGLFGSREAIVRAKGELMEALPASGHAFVNGDSTACHDAAKRARCPVTVVSTDAHGDSVAQDIEETKEGLAFGVNGTAFAVSMHGIHNVTNILLAIAVASKLGVQLTAIAQSLVNFCPPARTFSVREEQEVTILDDTYNSSPQSVLSAIEWAESRPFGQKVLLVSGVIELGAEEASTHARLAEHASRVFNRAYVSSPTFLSYFTANGFGERASLMPKKIEPLKPGSLLVCVGRMPQSTMAKFLP